MEHRTGFEPVSGASATPCLEPTDQRLIGDAFGRGGQNRTVTTSFQNSDASVTPRPENWILFFFAYVLDFYFLLSAYVLDIILGYCVLDIILDNIV